MGLTSGATGRNAMDAGLVIQRQQESDRVIALSGNPNVGKSTVFNALTHMNQHTGNWPGKTVCNAQGEFHHAGTRCIMVDIPGSYSLMAHSAEEEVARDFICFGGADAVVVVCDATCLERNLNLVLQTIEITPNTVVLLNLMDEAEKKRIHIDLALLEERLGVPVIGAVARSGKGMAELTERMLAVAKGDYELNPLKIQYRDEIESAILLLEPHIAPYCRDQLSSRWVTLRLLEGDGTLIRSISEFLGIELMQQPDVREAVAAACNRLKEAGLTEERFKDSLVSSLYGIAESICADAVTFERSKYDQRQLKADRILTNRYTGIPIMLLLLCAVLWLTMVGANYPSELLSRGLFWVQDRLTELFKALNAPEWLHGALVLGVYRVLAWVVSVMLPPMAIFFPLFKLLEDLGYLPRVAFNLDRHFKRCCACGKQALTMWVVKIRMQNPDGRRDQPFLAHPLLKVSYLWQSRDILCDLPALWFYQSDHSYRLYSCRKNGLDSFIQCLICPIFSYSEEKPGSTGRYENGLCRDFICTGRCVAVIMRAAFLHRS